MKKRPARRLQVSLTQAQHKHLAQRAKAEGKSVATVALEIVDRSILVRKAWKVDSLQIPNENA